MIITFGPFQLDVENQRLRQGDHIISLSPKPFAVLLYLLHRPGQLVSKEELLDACWPETAVTDTVLKVCIRQIREALGDDAKSPKFIETSHRRGYCFVGQTTTDAISEAEGPEWESALHQPVRETSLPSGMVGREAELAEVRRLFERACKGERQVLFVSGEAGIGKTALVEAFLKTLDSVPGILVARGQCLEQYGAAEAYLPVLEAVSRLCREHTSPTLVELLVRFAPTWVAQIPALTAAGDVAALRRETLGATRDRMVREMAETLESLTANTPFLLVLEDLHWSDYSTVDLISALARRRESARLMLIGTYRPVDLILREHPLKAVKQELQLHRQCEELELDYLSESAIKEYLDERFPSHQFPEALTHVIHHRTEGNPLFMVNLIDSFFSQGSIAPVDGAWQLKVELKELEVGMPENIRQMISKQIDRLSKEDQQVLEAASICGMKFSALAVASALAVDVVGVEERCEQLSRQSFFLKPRGAGEFPDGTVSARYGFTHSLYLNVLNDRIPAARGSRLHQSMAERGEVIYRDRVGEIASELAMHFEQGRDYQRAIKYLRLSADIDSRRYAGREAIQNLEHAMKLIGRLPESEQQSALIAVLEQRAMARRAMGDMSRAAADFSELASLAHDSNRVELEAKALLHAASAFSWVARERCPETFERAVGLIPKLQDELLKTHVRAYWGYWHSRFVTWREQDEVACVNAIEATKQAGDRALLSMHVARYPYYLCLRSDYQAACEVAEEGSWLTLEAGDGFDYLYCLFYWAWALLHAGKWGKMRAVLRTATDVAEKNGQTLLGTLLNLENAWLSAQAFDFERANEICERILAQTSEGQHETGNFLGLILRGNAQVGLGRYDDALECLSKVANRLEREQVLMEWILRLPLKYGLSQSLLGGGDLDRARHEAEDLCELASLPGERTYLALGHQMLAEIALAAGDQDRAEREIKQALNVLEGVEVPLAEWRVHSAAASVYKNSGRSDDVARHLAERAKILHRLAESLGESDELRTSLLSAAGPNMSRPAGRD